MLKSYLAMLEAWNVNHSFTRERRLVLAVVPSWGSCEVGDSNVWNDGTRSDSAEEIPAVQA